jgi:hypothetical protein
MPKRPATHVLEAASKRALRAAVEPAGWIVRDVDPDYGIDLEIELVAGDGTVTGRVIKAQLKATADTKAAPALRVRVEHLAYWCAMDVPVMIVRYRSSDGALWWLWAHDHLLHRNNGAPPETVSVTLPARTRWHDGTLTHVAGDVERWRARRRGHLEPPLRLLVQPHELPAEQAAEVREHLLACAAANQRLVRLTFDARSDHVAVIDIDGRFVRAILPIGASHTYHLHPLGPWTGHDALVQVGECLEREGHRLGADLVAATITGSRIAGSQHSAPALAHLLARAGHLDALEAVADQLEHDGNHAAIGYRLVGLQAAQAHPDRLAPTRLEAEARAAEAAGQPRQASLLWYRAAHQRGTLQQHDAGRDGLDAAARLSPGYLQRADWWRDRGAASFALGRFGDAVDDYRRAVQLGDPTAEGRLGDALLRCGHYADAAASPGSVVGNPDRPPRPGRHLTRRLVGAGERSHRQRRRPRHPLGA